MAYLPGQVIRTSSTELAENVCSGGPEGNCGKPAELSICGEVDSFGHEAHFMCRACHDDMKKNAIENPHLETCPRCKAEAVLIAHRDPDEGSNGPLYYLCGPCLKISNAYYMEGLSEAERGQDQNDDRFDEDDQDDDPWTPEEEEAFLRKLEKDEAEFEESLMRTDGEQA